MPRSDAYLPKLESPVKRYLSWSSNDKTFVYYDKEKATDVKLKLPLQILHLDEFGTIKGYHEKTQSSIYSNEVKSSKKEEFNVRSWKSPVSLAKGIYSNIKPIIEAIGGHYCVSIYVLLDGEIVNLSLKGASLQHWSEFTKNFRKDFLGHTITISGASDLKKGAVKYSVPVFEIGAPIDAKLSKESDEKFDILQEYFKARKANSDSSSDVITAEAEEVKAPTFAEAPVEHALDDDPLPF